MKNISAKRGENQRANNFKIINGYKIIDIAGKGAFG